MNSLKNFYFLNVRDKKRVMTFIIRILKNIKKIEKWLKLLTQTRRQTIKVTGSQWRGSHCLVDWHFWRHYENGSAQVCEDNFYLKKKCFHQIAVFNISSLKKSVLKYKQLHDWFLNYALIWPERFNLETDNKCK